MGAGLTPGLLPVAPFKRDVVVVFELLNTDGDSDEQRLGAQHQRWFAGLSTSFSQRFHVGGGGGGRVGGHMASASAELVVEKDVLN